MMFHEYEMVKLRKNIPELNLKSGAVGVVVLIYGDPNLPRAYEVDFSNFDGKELVTATILEGDLEKA